MMTDVPLLTTLDMFKRKNLVKSLQTLRKNFWAVLNSAKRFIKSLINKEERAQLLRRFIISGRDWANYVRKSVKTILHNVTSVEVIEAAQKGAQLRVQAYPKYRSWREAEAALDTYKGKSSTLPKGFFRKLFVRGVHSLFFMQSYIRFSSSHLFDLIKSLISVAICWSWVRVLRISYSVLDKMRNAQSTKSSVAPEIKLRQPMVSPDSQQHEQEKNMDSGNPQIDAISEGNRKESVMIVEKEETPGFQAATIYSSNKPMDPLQAKFLRYAAAKTAIEGQNLEGLKKIFGDAPEVRKALADLDGSDHSRFRCDLEKGRQQIKRPSLIGLACSVQIDSAKYLASDPEEVAKANKMIEIVAYLYQFGHELTNQAVEDTRTGLDKLRETGTLYPLRLAIQSNNIPLASWIAARLAEPSKYKGDRDAVYELDRQDNKWKKNVCFQALERRVSLGDFGIMRALRGLKF